MLSDAGRGATDHRFVDLEPCRRLRLPHPSDHRLIELGDDVARHHLLVIDDLAAAQFEVNKAAIGGPAPRVGEHTREVLRDLGYDDGAIDKMISEKSIRVAV